MADDPNNLPYPFNMPDPDGEDGMEGLSYKLIEFDDAEELMQAMENTNPGWLQLFAGRDNDVLIQEAIDLCCDTIERAYVIEEARGLAGSVMQGRSDDEIVAEAEKRSKVEVDVMRAQLQAAYKSMKPVLGDFEYYAGEAQHACGPSVGLAGVFMELLVHYLEEIAAGNRRIHWAAPKDFRIFADQVIAELDLAEQIAREEYQVSPPEDDYEKLYVAATEITDLYKAARTVMHSRSVDHSFVLEDDDTAPMPAMSSGMQLAIEHEEQFAQGLQMLHRIINNYNQYAPSLIGHTVDV